MKLKLGGREEGGGGVSDEQVGLRLGGKLAGERGCGGHDKQPRVSWAVKQMREDLLNEERKPWRNKRNRELWGQQIIIALSSLFLIFLLFIN